ARGALPGALERGEAAPFPDLATVETAAADYWHAGLSTACQPVVFLRRQLDRLGAVTARGLQALAHGRPVRVGGLVVVRQRPQTAKGFVFCTLEDETGLSNVVLAPSVYAQYRPVVRSAPLLLVEGVVEREGDTVNVWTRRAWPLTPEAPTGAVRSRD